nr:brain acid soluble protein 1-like [Aegilops tauschii subsp. strangulata]
MVPKSTKGKGVAKDAGAAEPPENSSSVNPEDVDAVIEGVAKAVMADAEKIAAEEAAKDAAEDTAEGLTGEASKAAAEEADKGPAGEAGGAAAEEEEEAGDQPSPSAASGSGASSTKTPVEGEVFDDEVLAATGLEVVDEPIGGDGSLEERLLHAMGACFRKLQDWFCEAHKELKAAQGEQAKRNVELTMKLADVEKAQATAKNLAAAAEAARTQREAALNSQEEDLAAREAKLAAMLRGKDAEVEKLVL